MADRLTVLAEARPYVTQIIRDERGLSLSGYAPSEAALLAVSAQIGARAVDVQLASGTSEGRWRDAMNRAVESLSRLEFGTLRFEDNQLHLTATARFPDDAQAALAALRGTADRFALRTRYHDEALHDQGRPAAGVAQDAEARSAVRLRLTRHGDLPIKELPVDDLTFFLGDLQFFVFDLPFLLPLCRFNRGQLMLLFNQPLLGLFHQRLVISQLFFDRFQVLIFLHQHRRLLLVDLM